MHGQNHIKSDILCFWSYFERATEYCFELFPTRVDVVEENYARALLCMSINRGTLLLVSPVF